MRDFSFEELLDTAQIHYTQQLPLVITKEPNTNYILCLDKTIKKFIIMMPNRKK